MSFSAGDKIGAYEVVEVLGRGGMATVYKAYQISLDRHVAIKVLHAMFQEDDSFLRRFQREARVVARLEHPHIVSIYDFAKHEGYPYLVMRFIDGETLKEQLTQGMLSRRQMVRVAGAMAQALDYAHGKGILHRDVKPSNVLLAPGGGVFITDFGLARLMQAGESTMSQDMIMGTPQYISPEQAKGESELDGRTDVYSFAIVLYEMVAGRVPFQSDTSYSIVHAHIFEAPPDPRLHNEKISPALAEVLLKALSKAPEDRYASAGQLFAAFRDAMEGLTADPILPGRQKLPDSTAPSPTRQAQAEPPIPKPIQEEAAVAPAPPPPVPAEEERTPPQPEPVVEKSIPPESISEAVPAAEEAAPGKQKKEKRRRLRPILLGAVVGMFLCACLIVGLGIFFDDEGDEVADEVAVELTAVAAEVATEIAAEFRVEAEPPPPREEPPPEREGPAPEGAAEEFLAFMPGEEIRSPEQLRPLLEADPRNLPLRAELAASLLQNGRTDEARPIVRETFERSRLPIPYLRVGERLLESDHVSLAALVLQEGYRRFPADPRLQQLLVMSLIESEQPPSVVDDLLNRIIEDEAPINPVAVQSGEAYVAYLQGDPELALLILDELLTLENNPYLAEVLYLEGKLLADLGEVEVARDAFAEALEYQPPPWLTVRIERFLGELP